MKETARLKFALLPTPVESLPRLSKALGGPQILIKRDDLTGLAFGGNKIRKLEFLIAEAKEQGAGTLVTTGAIQSNQCRQTAAAAARFGFECILVLTGEMPAVPKGNFLLSRLLGAQIINVPDRSNRDRILNETFKEAESGGKKPYLVPYGGSSPTGVMGYVFALKELMEQNVNPDWIVFGTSSGGTHAGLVLGQRLFGYKGKVLGISVDESEAALKTNISSLASGASLKLGNRIDFTPSDVLAADKYCKAGYGVVTGAEREAMKMFAQLEGMLLDPVYTGRTAAGMIDLIRKGFFGKNETVLFWHTGGLPALFTDEYGSSII